LARNAFRIEEKLARKPSIPSPRRPQDLPAETARTMFSSTRHQTS